MSEEIEEDFKLPPLRIPESAYKPLRQIIGLGEMECEKLKQTIISVGPQATRERLIERVADGIHPVDYEKVDAIIGELFRINYVRAQLELSTEDVADLIADGAKVSERVGFSINEEEFTSLKQRLITLLDAHKTLTLTAKANDLLGDHQHCFYSARLFSDMRPVYSSDVSSIEAGIVIHDLVIHYGDSEDHKDFHVLLDDADIQALRETLDRAEKKSAVLRRMMKTANISYLPTSD